MGLILILAWMFNTSELDALFRILNSIKGFKLRQPQWSNTTIPNSADVTVTNMYVTSRNRSLRLTDTTVTQLQSVTNIPSTTTTSVSQYTKPSTSQTNTSSQPLVPTEIPPFQVDCTNSNALCMQNSTLKEVRTALAYHRTSIINMYLRDNVIQTLDSKCFTGLTHLKVLVLNHNKISSIGGGTFRDQGNLMQLDLSYNVINTLDGTMFQGLASLRVLRITGNNLTSIDPQTFSNLNQINTIQVDIIQLTVFRQIILNPFSYPNPPKVPKVEVEDAHFFPCNSSYCWLKAAEEKGYMKHYKYNGKVSRPKCSDHPGVYWDEVELDCPSSYSASGIQYDLTPHSLKLIF